MIEITISSSKNSEETGGILSRREFTSSPKHSGNFDKPKTINDEIESERIAEPNLTGTFELSILRILYRNRQIVSL